MTIHNSFSSERLHKTYYPTGELETEAYYLDNVLHGEYRHWRIGGEILFITNYVFGREHGIMTKYYHDGTIEYQSEYEHGKMIKHPKFTKKEMEKYNSYLIIKF